MRQPPDLSCLRRVGDPAASIAWYRKSVGLNRLSTCGEPGVRAVFVGRGDIRVELVRNDDAARMSDARRRTDTKLRIGGIGRLARAVADLGAAIGDLRKRQPENVAPPRDVPDGSGPRFASIHDHEGMLGELPCSG